MKDPVAVIIPLYKSQLNSLEKISLQQCFNVLSSHTIIAVKPKALELDHYNFDFDDVVSFENQYFEDIAGYNKLMLSPDFYERFLQYNYILIYQPDAFVFKDDLLYWCNQNYDYIGAPWLRYTLYPDGFKKLKNQTLRYIHTKLNLKLPNSDLPTEIQLENRVGNGGFSLRNTSVLRDVCIKNKAMIEYYNSRMEHQFNEDVFFSIEANRRSRQINVPDYKIGIHFSMNDHLDHAFKLTKGKLPFGCHAWNLYQDFWAPIMAETNGVDITNFEL